MNGRSLLCLLALILLVGACSQRATQVRIEGVIPYQLGVPQGLILKANTALKPETASVMGEMELTYQNLSGLRKLRGDVVSTTDYAGVLASGAEGLTKEGWLSLQFYEGRLASVIIFWPNFLFSVPGLTQISIQEARDLYHRVLQKYGRSNQDTLSRTGGAEGQATFRDDQGNVLMMMVRIPGVGAILAYGWGPFVRVVEEAKTR